MSGNNIMMGGWAGREGGAHCWSCGGVRNTELARGAAVTTIAIMMTTTTHRL